MTYRGLVRVAGVPALLLAMTLSRLAGRMFALALVLYALARFPSPAMAGWLTFAAVAPGLAASPVAGTVLDRLGPAVAVGIDLGASAALILAVVAAGLSGWDSAPVLFTLAVLYSLTTPLGAAGVRTMLPRLVPPAALDRVNGLDTAINAAVNVVGPATAGLLAALAGPSAALAAAALCLLAVPPVPAPPASGGSVLRQTVEGVAAVLREPTLRGLAVSYSLYRVTWGALLVVVPVFAAERYATEAGSTVAGMLWAAMGLAGGVGALAAGHLRTAGRERPVMAAGMALTALAAWPVAAFGVGGLVAGLMLVGLASGPIDVALLTLRHRRTDPRQLGRVLSISMSLNLAGTPVGSALAGMLIAGSLPATFALAALASVLGALATLAIPSDAARAV